MNQEINEIIGEVLQSLNHSVKAAHIKDMISLMTKHFKFFKTALINLIDRILTLEEKDQIIKSLYTLISKFFSELNK